MRRNDQIHSLGRRGPILSLLLAIGLAACATTEDGPDGPRRTHYTLKLGDRIPYHAPLPTRTNIQVTWYLSNGGSEAVDGYRGWDFDGDDRFEMVEVLTEDGGVQSRVFDFDGDGLIDLVR